MKCKWHDACDAKTQQGECEEIEVLEKMKDK
jgi:hypothetical protein